MIALKPDKDRLQALVKLSAYAVHYDTTAIPGTSGDAYVKITETDAFAYVQVYRITCYPPG